MSLLMPPFPDLTDILALERLGDGLFRAHSHQANHAGWIFGGSLLAQALHAAELTAPERVPHSLHAQFYRPASCDMPLDLESLPIHDGANFSRRRVSASQRGRLVFEALVSLQVVAVGLEHTREWREPPPPPASVPTLEQVSEAFADRIPAAQRDIIARFSEALEARIIDAEDFLLRRSKPRGRFWVRPRLGAGRSLPSGYAALPFVSDFLMPASCNLPHFNSTFDPIIAGMSLDHVIWLHAPLAAGAWILHEVHSPWAGAGRGLNFGSLYAQDGRLLASCAQEQLMTRTNAQPSE